MLTLEELVRDSDLALVAGEGRAAAPVRWVHISELPDPTPWLSGGELLLTTGLQLTTEDAQREFVRRLAAHHLAGLGFGTGFTHPQIPEPVVDEARSAGLPLFEVPYELPFIALTERAFTRLVNEHYDTLQRALDIQRRLERLVLEDRGLGEVVRALSAAIGGAAVVVGERDDVLATATFRRGLPEDLEELAGRGAEVRVVGGARLLAARDEGALGDFERLILQQAATVVALELMRRRVVRDTERRLAADVVAAALAGRLEPREIGSRLAPFGVGPEAAVLLLDLEDPVAAEPALQSVLGDAGLVAIHDGLLCAVVSGPGAAAHAERARKRLGARAAISRSRPVERLRQAFVEARCVLRTANGKGVATWDDLGAHRLLLSLQDDEALSVYAETVLGPLDGELLRSLEAYIEENGNWERAARSAACHRHTLRHRIRRVEELTGRDLGRAEDRIEMWLALRARELAT